MKRNTEEYDKLVRNEIPSIIRDDPDVARCQTRRVSGEELHEYLIDKLYEEVEEYDESHDREELADILQVLWDIARFRDISWNHLRKHRWMKKLERGNFSDGIVLKRIEYE